MYFLYKQGVHGQGVFWIGEDFEEGKRQADNAATSDSDDYHDWNLCKYTPVAPSEDKYFDPTEVVYTGVRA